MALLLCALLLLPCVPVVRADGGSCGDNLSWSLSAGVLTISGSGAMWDYTEKDMSPWYPVRDEIVQLVLPAGLTKIGDLAFYECKNLITVTIPDSVEKIGAFAFTGCEKLEYLTMGGNVRSIGEYAFSECYALRALHLPGGLTAIGSKAFYRCESIPAIVVPESVTSLGMLAFGYCKSLISAEIRANIHTIPEYLFYECNMLSSVSLPKQVDNMGSYVFEGCDNLSTVYYEGTGYTVEELENTINKSVPQFESTGNISGGSPSGYTTTETTKTDENGAVVQENVSVSQGSGTTISSKVEKTEESTDVSFSVTIENEDDWDSAKLFIESTLNSTDNPDDVTIDIYLKDSGTIDSGFVQDMTDKGANIKVIAQNGSVWQVEANSQQKKEEKEPGGYDLRFTLSEGSDELTAQLEAQKSFVIQFHGDAAVNAEVLVQLGSEWGGCQATLFRHEKEGVSVIQTVVVDRSGYAHFYLTSVLADVKYSIGMQVPSEENNAIVPDVMLSEYGDIEKYRPQYEITGRKSSWNMGLGRVMAILAVVMVGAIGIVGAIMFFWNKQRIKNGYTPQWDDDDE